jgi:hypothetical protein
MEGMMANDRQILNKKLIAMLVYEAMVRKIRGTSEPFNAHGCQLAVDYLWTRGEKALILRLLRSTTHPY